jgi:hypothetical protein
MAQSQIPFDVDLLFYAVRGLTQTLPDRINGSTAGGSGPRYVEHRYTEDQLKNHKNFRPEEMERMVREWLLNFKVLSGTHCTYGLLPRPLPNEEGAEILSGERVLLESPLELSYDIP